MKLTYQKTTLANGLRVLTCSLPHTYSVGVGFYLSVGSRYEDEQLAGAAHFVEHMLFKGTARYPTAQALASLIEGHGGLFNASTGRESTVVWFKMQQQHTALALDTLAEMLRFSLLLPEEVEKERRVILEEISSSQDIPEELASLLVHDITWPGHPLGRDVAGTPASVASLDHRALRNFLATYYTPQNTVLSVAGDVQHEAIVAAATDLFAGWQPAAPTAFVPAPIVDDKPRVALIKRPCEQTHLALHLPGVSRSDADRYALGLLNVILGEGMSSRLFLEVRERLGLAYAVESYASFLADTGVVGVYAAVAPDQAHTGLNAVLAELRRLRQEPVDDQTLRNAKEFAKGQIILGMEDTLAAAGWFGRQEILGQPIMTVEDTLERMEQVTAEHIMAVAQRLFHPAGTRLAIVGPHRKKDIPGFQSLLNAGALA